MTKTCPCCGSKFMGDDEFIYCAQCYAEQGQVVSYGLFEDLQRHEDKDDDDDDDNDDKEEDDDD